MSKFTDNLKEVDKDHAIIILVGIWGIIAACNQEWDIVRDCIIGAFAILRGGPNVKSVGS